MEQGTTARQRVHVATLASLPERTRKAGAQSPALPIVGEVVHLQQWLDWFRPVEEGGCRRRGFRWRRERRLNRHRGPRDVRLLICRCLLPSLGNRTLQIRSSR